MNTEEEIYEKALNTYLNIGINYGANTIKNADVGDLQQLVSDSFNAGYQLKLKQRDETIKQLKGALREVLDYWESHEPPTYHNTAYYNARKLLS